MDVLGSGRRSRDFFQFQPRSTVSSITGLEDVNGDAHERLSTKIDDIATIAARFGITSGPEDRTLWYVKGGAAWVRDNFSATVDANASFFGTFTGDQTFVGSGSVRENRWGWMVGTGVEWGLWNNWSAKIEYEFLDFGTKDFTIPVSGAFTGTDEFGSGPGNFNRTFSIQQQIHVVKVGLNYRFNWGY